MIQYLHSGDPPPYRIETVGPTERETRSAMCDAVGPAESRRWDLPNRDGGTYRIETVAG